MTTNTGPAWYRALTLAERSRLPQVVDGNSSVIELAERRFERWRGSEPFASNAALFQERLGQDELSDDSALLQIMSEQPDALARRCGEPPPWIQAITRTLARSWPDTEIPLPPGYDQIPSRRFIEVVRPFIEDARARLRAGIAAFGAPARARLEPSTLERGLLAHVAEKLLRMIMKVMVLELNVARVRGALSGETPDQRFASFLERLHDRSFADAVLEEYATLTRQVTARLEQWLVFCLEFVKHYLDDYDALQARFAPGRELGILRSFEPGAGDLHRGGRSVGIATFDSGVRIVYKPKSLGVDMHFQALLTWLNERGMDPWLRPLAMLDRGAHGWVEHVAPQPCETPDQARRFYLRQGGYLAVCHLLGGRDLHNENIIAAGEHPMLIDLEVLLQPRFAEDASPFTAIPSLTMSVDESLLGSSMLPRRTYMAEGYEGIDLSGLGAADAYLTPQKNAAWEDLYTDSMRLVRKRVPMPASQNQPRLGSQRLDAGAYVDELIAGFDTAYELMTRHRDALTAADGPLEPFSSDEIRIVVRPTRYYLRLLGEGTHPDLMRDALERDRHFDHLWRIARWRERFPELIPCERAALERGDVPLFVTRADSHDLWSDRGERFPGFFAESGVEVLHRRVQQLGERDRARQRWCIRASFAAIHAKDAPLPDQASAPTQASPPPAEAAGAEPQRMLAIARAIGERLFTLAHESETEVAWNAVKQVGERKWIVGPAGLDLYTGTAGIGLFLAHLGPMLGDERVTALARKAAATLQHASERLRPMGTLLGGFEGWGSILYGLVNLGVILDEPAAIEQARSLLSVLPDLIAQDEHLDIVSGAAGCIGSLLALHRHAPDPEALAIAVACGEHLLGKAVASGAGLAWPTQLAVQHPLMGFAHGTTGIAWSLLALSAETGETRFQEAAARAIAYERAHFVAEPGDWPDLRAEQLPPRFTPSWCHGAPGIGLARIHALRHLDDPGLRDEVRAAATATLAHGFGHNHCLCHGDLGNLEFLRAASEALAEPALEAATARAQATILVGLESHDWRCATPAHVHAPGLMIGLAGIGYGLLRLAAPSRVPSVLTLQTVAPDSQGAS